MQKVHTMFPSMVANSLFRSITRCPLKKRFSSSVCSSVGVSGNVKIFICIFSLFASVSYFAGSF